MLHVLHDDVLMLCLHHFNDAGDTVLNTQGAVLGAAHWTAMLPLESERVGVLAVAHEVAHVRRAERLVPCVHGCGRPVPRISVPFLRAFWEHATASLTECSVKRGSPTLLPAH